MADRPARVLVIGGTGNFGQRVCRLLTDDAAVQIIVGSRHLAKARQFAETLTSANPTDAVAIDIDDAIEPVLTACAADIVIHTSGPFQNQDYQVARACIASGVHYLDLADARRFVVEFGTLDQAAKDAGIVAISGASSVPCLSAAVIDDALQKMARINSVDFGIATAQQTRRAGGATTAAVLSYAGQPFRVLQDGQWITRHGWQGLRRIGIEGLPPRLVADCDIPDLDLFPVRYTDLQTIRFSAGVEVGFLQFGLLGLSWLSRLGLLPRPDRLGPGLSRVATLFDRWGSDRSGFFMDLRGRAPDGQKEHLRFEICATSGDGPYIPAIPAALLARRLARGDEIPPGASPCVGFLELDELVAEMSRFDIRVQWRTVD